ncbi:hypothetical protein JL722_13180 [Aureococcus anophagefferens]|nr:hypothetical protein JL722_13180 [Aureococcus anophagefferens]
MEAAPLIHDETPEAARRQKAATYDDPRRPTNARRRRRPREPRRRRRRRRRRQPGFAARRRSPSRTTRARATSPWSQNASSGVSASDLNCSDYDDDTVYTNDSCVIYGMSCDMYCVSGSWCDFFCGDECARGGGAICALTVLSNLTKSCEKHGLCSAPGSVSVTSVESDDSAPTPKPTASRASANGCDHHAICSYCLPNDYCQELVLDGVIEAANMAMLLLSQFEQTCAAYGCDDWVAAQVR